MNEIAPQFARAATSLRLPLDNGPRSPFFMRGFWGVWVHGGPEDEYGMSKWSAHFGIAKSGDWRHMYADRNERAVGADCVAAGLTRADFDRAFAKFLSRG